MKILIKPLQLIYCVYALLMFIIIMFVAVPFVIIASFFGRVRGGNIIYKIVKVWSYAWYLLIGIRHKNIYEAQHDASRQYMFVANHISYMDIPPILLAITQPVRVLAKYELSKIPIFGYVYKSAAVMVDRGNAEKRAESVAELKNFIGHGVSIFIYPEGTLNETGAPLKEFFDGAFRIAIESQIPIKPVLLIDTLERLHYNSLFSLTPGPNRVVFMEEVPVAGLTLVDVQVLKQRVYDMMDRGLGRYRNYPEEQKQA